MAEFTLRSFQQILGNMISILGANTPLTDINPGSVILTTLEAIATEDANTYIQMLNIIREFNLDTTTGLALDDRAYEDGLIRLPAKYASGYVTFTDTNVTRVASTVYSGLPGAGIGASSINISDATGFPTSGAVIIGRGSNNAETIPYDSITPVGNHFVVHFTSPAVLTKDHGTDEIVILSQGGNRLITAGTTVYVPESDLTDKIDYTLQSDAVILDGEREVSGCLVICTQQGSLGNVNVGAIRYLGSSPFSGLTVTNPAAFSNGRDVETDNELRERIKANRQSLSRGTITSILTAASMVSSDEQNNKVVSCKFQEATTLNELNFLFIDDGTGLEPMFDTQAYEVILESAQGGERFLQIDNNKTPIAKGALETLNSEPFGILAGTTLTVEVGGVQETMVFGGIGDFVVPGAGTAEEVTIALNSRMNLIEARTAENKTKVVIEARAYFNEGVKVVGGAPSTANGALGFKENITIETMKLYRNDVLLHKDGITAYVISGNAQPFTLPNPSFLTLQVDNVPITQTIAFTTEVTAQQVADTINLQIMGAHATVITDSVGNKVMITSNNPNPGYSAIKITGGTANSGGIRRLAFSTVTQAGVTQDYALNKYNGQIELMTVAAVNDEFVVGSPYTRAYLQGNTEPISVILGETLIFQVDDIIDSSVSTLVDASNFIDGSLATNYVDDHFKGIYVRFKDTTTTVALQGVARLITGYNGTTGQFTTSAFPAVPQVGDTYEVVQIVTMPVNASYTAAQINTALAPLIRGASFYSKRINLNNYLRMQSNSFNNNAKIKVLSASTCLPHFGFTPDVTVDCQESNFGFIESGNEQNFTFGTNQNAIFVIDNDYTHKTVDITMQVSGAVDGNISTTQFTDTTLSANYATNNCFKDMVLRFRDTTPTVLLKSVSRVISAWNYLTGTFTTAAFPAAPAVGDLYDILPVTSKNVAYLFNNRAFTTLGIYCDILESSNGTKVQISTKTQGTAGSVRCSGGSANNFSIPFIHDGDALGHFEVESADGLCKGLPVYLVDADSGPTAVTITDITMITAVRYVITCTVDAGGTDVSMFLVSQGASVIPRNAFNFTTIPNEGVDGYKWYRGLIQETQWTIDGKDTDIINYPGVKAAGVMIETRAPLVRYVTCEVDVTLSEGVTLIMVMNDVKGAISNYINNLGVGKHVIVSEIVAAVMAITGVVDVDVLVPAVNVPIAYGEKAAILESDIQVG